MLDAGRSATLSCLLEVTASKPGNVHRGADFEDLTFADFAVSAVAIQPAMAAATVNGVGATALAAIRATRQWTRTNTNLGIVLLLAPLAAVPADLSLAAGVSDVLSRLTPADAELVYEAIRLANPGGMGEVAEHDVRSHPPADLMTAMKAAEAHDMVARQYCRQYEDVFGFVLPRLAEQMELGHDLLAAIVYAHVSTLAEFPDSLIRRKCGEVISQEASTRARQVIEAEGDDYIRSLADLDFWLRSDGHRRNPGTTADLVAAALFCGFRDGTIQPPLSF